MGKQKELLQKAFTAIESEGAIDSLIIGDGSSVETRTTIADAFFYSSVYEKKRHRRKKAKNPRRHRIRK